MEFLMFAVVVVVVVVVVIIIMYENIKKNASNF